jgi:hypothetical protein
MQGHQEHTKDHHDKVDHLKLELSMINGKVLDLMMTL